MRASLDKAVCMWCMAHERPVNGTYLRMTGKMERNGVPVPWQFLDEQMWRNGKVLCPHATREKEFSVVLAGCPRRGLHEGCMGVEDL